MYQIFDDVSSPAASGERVKALQRELKSRKLKGFLVPHSDEHQDEFLPLRPSAWPGSPASPARRAWPSCWRRRRRCSSTGAIRCRHARRPTPTLFEVLQTPDAKPSSWIADKLTKGAAIGYDPALHTIKEIERLTEALGKSGIKLTPVDTNLDRSRLAGPAESLPPPRSCRTGVEYAGKSAHDKIRDVQALLKDENARRRAAHPAQFHRLAVQYQGRRPQAYAGRARLRHRAGERQADPVHRSRQGGRQRQGDAARIARCRRAIDADGKAQGAR